MDIFAHRAAPGISIDQHVKRRVVELGQSLDNRAAIFLDTKFWILLRDCASGSWAGAAETELLQRLRALVAAGKAFCPISESIFLEFMKQDDVASRLRTATLVDELSLGVTLLDLPSRMATEIARFFHSTEINGGDLHPLQHLVWSKLPYALGFVHPANTGFDAETELALQKAFFDKMWTIPLTEMFSTVGETPGPGGLDFGGALTSLNEGVAQHTGVIKSFTQAYADELRGMVSLCGNMAMEVLSELMGKRTALPPPPPGSGEWKKAQRYCENILYFSLKDNPEARKQLPTLHIEASLHAALRWDKRRRFTANDLYDFVHASAALGYCRAFFTEHGLCSMVSAKNVALDRFYQCCVTSDVPGAIRYLESLESSPPASRAA
jgi:hypothetical protein